MTNEQMLMMAGALVLNSAGLLFFMGRMLDGQNKRIDDFRNDLSKRIDDMRDLLRAEIRAMTVELKAEIRESARLIK